VVTGDNPSQLWHATVDGGHDHLADRDEIALRRLLLKGLKGRQALDKLTKPL
jgi:hypothetical protein